MQLKISSSRTLSLAAALCVLANAVIAQQGPIYTNNGVSACVQFGSCTQNGNQAATTETQQAPVTPPASSQIIAPPTNSAESAASISNLAATGAAAAYSSRVANGQGTGNAPNGATSVPLTGTVIAGTAPATQPKTSGSGGKDAAFRLDSGFTHLWTSAMALVAIVGGALVVL